MRKLEKIFEDDDNIRKEIIDDDAKHNLRNIAKSNVQNSEMGLDKEIAESRKFL